MAAAAGGERDGARVDLLRRGPRGGWVLRFAPSDGGGAVVGWGLLAWFGSLEAGACDPAPGLHPAQCGLRPRPPVTLKLQSLGCVFGLIAVTYFIFYTAQKSGLLDMEKLFQEFLHDAM